MSWIRVVSGHTEGSASSWGEMGSSRTSWGRNVSVYGGSRIEDGPWIRTPDPQGRNVLVEAGLQVKMTMDPTDPRGETCWFQVGWTMDPDPGSLKWGGMGWIQVKITRKAKLVGFVRRCVCICLHTVICYYMHRVICIHKYRPYCRMCSSY